MKFLTAEEIRIVEQDARESLHLMNENHICLPVSSLSVISLSPVHGLIFIQGNRHTGFEHIIQRHAYFSPEFYWADGDNPKPSYPSKFSPRSIPIFEYADIADAIYDKQYLNLEGNKHPDLLDLYNGRPESKGIEPRKYKMLLYKDTKIIHTLYPTNEKYTLKKPSGFIFRRGDVSGNENLLDGTINILIPYFDHLGTKRYTIVFGHDYAKKNKSLKITIHRSNREDLKSDYNQTPLNEKEEKLGILVNSYQYANLTGVETEILNIEQDRENWQSIP